MTRAEEAGLQLPLQVYLIQGERIEGEKRDPPIAPVRELTEIRAVDEYMRLYGKRPVRTFERMRTWGPLPGLTPAAGPDVVR